MTRKLCATNLLLVTALVLMVCLLVFLPTISTDAYAQLEAKKTRARSDVVLYQTFVDFLYNNLAIILVTSYLLLFTVGVLHRCQMLPHRLERLISFVFSFELSRKHALVVGILLLSLYIIQSSAGIQHEESFADYTSSGLKNDIEKFGVSYFSPDRVVGFSRLVKYTLLSLSLQIFGNVRIVPFLASTAMVVLTYLITKEISRKRFAGIIAMVMFVQSSTFRAYDDSAAYDNFSTLFYMLSIYALLKARWWYASPVLQLLAIFSKAISAVFIPFSMFFAYRTLPRPSLLSAIISYGILFGISVAAVLAGAIEGIRPQLGNETLSRLSYALPKDWQLDDPLVFTFLPPVIAGLFLLARKGLRQADAIMLLLAGMLWISFLLTALTGVTSQLYRLVPLIAFFAIGAGLMFSRTDGLAKRDRIETHLAILAFSLLIVLANLNSLFLP